MTGTASLNARRAGACPQIGDMREAPDLELRVAEPLARCAVAQTSDPVGERRQLRPRGLGHAGHAKAPGDDVCDEACPVAALSSRKWKNLSNR